MDDLLKSLAHLSRSLSGGWYGFNETMLLQHIMSWWEMSEEWWVEQFYLLSAKGEEQETGRENYCS